MIDKNEWLRDECRKVRLSKCKISRLQFVILLVFCLLLGGASFLYCRDDFIDRSVHIIEDSRDTWECGRCGYKNYEGIERCAICGKKR
jgi:hypothetical protein